MSKRFRFILLLIAVFVAGLFLYPTVQWYFLFGDAQRGRAEITQAEAERQVGLETAEVNRELTALALDDIDGAVPEKYAFLIPIAEQQYIELERDLPNEWTIRALLDGFVDGEQFIEEVNRYYLAEIEGIRDIRSQIIQLGLDLAGGVQVLLEPDLQKLRDAVDGEPTAQQIDESLDLALEVITNRIDRFGITEPQIRRRDDDTIEIILPGEDDPERVNAFLVGKGQLNFHIVDDDATNQLLNYEAGNPDFDPLIDEAPDFIPAGTRIVPYYTRDIFDLEEFVRNIVIHTNIDELGLSGEYINDAQYVRDPLTNQPTVNFVLDIEGSNRFATLTDENVGNSMAIVVDNNARAYVFIREVIPNGQVRISGFSQTEAQNIARVLRTASLPIDLEILSQQSVGSLLGEETVLAGLRAILLGLILVALFVFVYYKGAGFIADCMLLLNLVILVSVLSVFNLTLTLTSIAGIILTVGMAVDANVIIYERIKEEYLEGKSVSAAVSAGFKKAFWTIFDANVTTFIAALFLSQFGSGPIRGFAVTLAVGIVTSMFTALFVSRLIFEFFTEHLRLTTLSIMWKRRTSR